MRLKSICVVALVFVSVTASWAEECPARIGRLPDGPATAVAVEGQYVFVGSGATVKVLDASDPSKLQMIGRVAIETEVRRIVVEEDLAFVVDGAGRMTIVDVSDVSTPVVAWWLDGSDEPPVQVNDVAATGRLAFVAARSEGLIVFDLADPTHPVQIGALDGIGTARWIAIDSNYAYIEANSMLWVVDVTDPANPAEVSVIGFDRGAYGGGGVVADNSMVYVVGPQGLQLIDVSSPDAPLLRGAVDWPYSFSHDLEAQGEFVFVSSSSKGVRVINVSDPEAPVQVELLDQYSRGRGVAVDGVFLYSAAYSDGVRVYVASNPSEPAEAGSFSTPGPVHLIAVDGDRGVAAIGDELTVLDMTDPADPAAMGVYRPSINWTVVCVDLVGDLAFVCNGADDRVVLFDTSDPGAVVQLAEIEAPGLSDLEAVPPSVYIQGDDLQIFDVSHATAPVQAGTLTGFGRHITVELPYLYQTRWSEGLGFPGLNVVDVSDPVHPRVVGSSFENDIRCCSRAAASGSFVYVLGYPGEGYNLNVVDARDPAELELVDSLYFGYMSDIAISGASGVLGVSDGNRESLVELDLSDPSSPVEVGRYRAPSGVGMVAEEDGLFYVVEGQLGFEIFEPCIPSFTESVWLEIAARGSGKNGSEWRTDAVVRNLGFAEATVELILHADGVEHEFLNSIGPRAQMVVEDVVGTMGVEGKGALEVRSTQPTSLSGRIYNQGDEGTFGQFLHGYGTEDGLSAGEAAWLHGLRQLDQTYRSNLSVTNTGQGDAAVRVTLFGTDGADLITYDLGPIGPGEVVQEIAPLAERAGRSDIGWAMARIEVVSGFGVLASGSVIDSQSNDPTTIPMVRDR